jgi:hypothetical protein
VLLSRAKDTGFPGPVPYFRPMAPWFTMPDERESLQLAAVADLAEAIRAMSCAVRLLDERETGAKSGAILGSIRLAIRRAESALEKLPNPSAR